MVKEGLGLKTCVDPATVSHVHHRSHLNPAARSRVGVRRRRKSVRSSPLFERALTLFTVRLSPPTCPPPPSPLFVLPSPA
ncbi:uncharacterized protein DS421_1g27640 [Arachis hypogaea]|nr:uncharacterized protein DS421_1g27640 [Arachis hypogaea]